MAFVEGWQLTLLLMTMVPLMAIAGSVLMKLMADLEGQAAKMYERVPFDVVPCCGCNATAHTACHVTPSRCLTKLDFCHASHRYAGAGAIAQEHLSGMRTVQAFGGQKESVKRYSAYLDKSLSVSETQKPSLLC